MTEGILNKTLAELFSILEKCFLLNLTPTSYPKQSKEIHRRLIKVRLQSFYKVYKVFFKFFQRTKKTSLIF